MFELFIIKIFKVNKWEYFSILLLVTKVSSKVVNQNCRNIAMDKVSAFMGLT